MEKKRKKRQRANQRCCIYGCNSSSFGNPDMKFFGFPSPNSRDYQTWLTACKDSYNQINITKRPFVCALHFYPGDIGPRRLNLGSFPRLKLVPSKEYIFTQKNKHKIKFLNKVMQEWLLRNRPDRDIFGRDLVAKAKEAADLLDIPISKFCWVTWLQDFNEDIAGPISKLLEKVESSDLSSEIVDIIIELRQQDQDKSTENSVEITDEDDFKKGNEHVDLYLKQEVSIAVKEEQKDDDLPLNHEIKEENKDYYESSTNLSKLESICLDLLKEGDTTENKKILATYSDALIYMKPLEEFALQKEDFRAIGKLAELEACFKEQL